MPAKEYYEKEDNKEICSTIREALQPGEERVFVVQMDENGRITINQA